jgi:hypothetical protein
MSLNLMTSPSEQALGAFLIELLMNVLNLLKNGSVQRFYTVARYGFR